MKRKIVVLILLLPSLAWAQSISPSFEKREAEEKLYELISSWNLGLNNEGEMAPDIRTYNRFINLFDSNATILNDIDAVFRPDSSRDPHPYKLNPEPVSIIEYAHDIVLHLQNLNIDTINVNYNMDSAYQNIVNINLKKIITGNKRRNYVFNDVKELTNKLIQYKKDDFKDDLDVEKIDTASVERAITKMINDGNESYLFTDILEIRIRMLKSNDVIKISSISFPKHSLSCKNDKDNDGVIDNEDCDGKNKSDTIQLGDITAMGCIDSDLDGVRDEHDVCDFDFGHYKNAGCPLNYFTYRHEVSFTVSYQTHSTELSMPALDKLGYASLDQSLSSPGKLDGNAVTTSPMFGASYSYFFNKNRKLGITAGLTIANYSTTYTVVDGSVYTYKSNDGVNDYRRQITLNNGSAERINYGHIAIPILLTYRYRPSELTQRDESMPNWWAEFSAGPTIFLFNNISNYNSNFNFEGLYQTDATGFIYTDAYDPSSTWNVSFTEDAINAQSDSPGAETVFSLLQQAGYDLAIDSNYSGEQNISTTGFGIKAQADLCYKFNDDDRFALKIGANLMYAIQSKQLNTYIMIDKTSDPYNSIYNGNYSTNFISYGIHLGAVFQF